MEFCRFLRAVKFVVRPLGRPLSLIESLMSRKANEFSEISQVYFRAG